MFSIVDRALSHFKSSQGDPSVDPAGREQATLVRLQAIADKKDSFTTSRSELEGMAKNLSAARREMLESVLAHTATLKGPGAQNAVRVACSVVAHSTEEQTAHDLCLDGLESARHKDLMQPFFGALLDGSRLSDTETRKLSKMASSVLGGPVFANPFSIERGIERKAGYARPFVEVLARNASDPRLQAVASAALQVPVYEQAGADAHSQATWGAYHATLRLGLRPIPSTTSSIDVLEQTMARTSFRTLGLEHFASSMQPFMKALQTMRPLTPEETAIASLPPAPVVKRHYLADGTEEAEWNPKPHQDPVANEAAIKYLSSKSTLGRNITWSKQDPRSPRSAFSTASKYEYVQIVARHEAANKRTARALQQSNPAAWLFVPGYQVTKEYGGPL